MCVDKFINAAVEALMGAPVLSFPRVIKVADFTKKESANQTLQYAGLPGISRRWGE